MRPTPILSRQSEAKDGQKSCKPRVRRKVVQEEHSDWLPNEDCIKKLSLPKGRVSLLLAY